ncbi:YndM family protein [Salipaludibacillus daqingensis]|uniref:YndM family protein n=1 Tax=Salipaludibacillus daqingensis TaxID=3041001 RepID=UPI00247332BE|nr:YndM family protein [Salipaludibacillus daqingensis]
MKHLNVLLIKFVTSIFIFWVSLGLLFNASFTLIISFSILLTISSYFIGDQIVLPRIGKNNTVVVDFFLAYFIVWVFGGVLFHSYLMIGWGSIISATLFAGSEMFVHSYIVKNIKSFVLEKQRTFDRKFAFEFAEEEDPNHPNDK